MRKITKEYKIYKFYELSKETQNIVLENLMQSEYNDYCEFYLHDDMSMYAEELLGKNFQGAEFKDVFYDLTYSQGSGSMIEFSIDFEDINKKYRMLTKKEIEKIESVGYTNIEVKHFGHYSHEYSFNFDWQDYTCYLENFEKTQEKIDKMLEYFKNDIVNMNHKLTKYGYENLDYYSKKENFRELAEEHEYFENGDIYV